MLLIPVEKIKSVVAERHDRHQQVIEEIAASSSTEQLVVGPILVQPYTKTVRVNTKESLAKGIEFETVEETGRLFFLPISLQIKVDMRNETRSRGIYDTQIYHANTSFYGSFKIPKNFGLDNLEAYQLHEPYLTLSVSDMRGIESGVSITFDNANLEVHPGTNTPFFEQGAHAFVNNIFPHNAEDLKFQVKMQLQGTSSMRFVPVGKSTSTSIKSDWPHPSFSGRFLPQKREISINGFSAFWETNDFSTNLPAFAKECFENNGCEDFFHTAFGVDFIDPVNLYVKTDRATKYALVGVAISMFYLLLMSFAEHIAFFLAYCISAFACAALIGCYMAYALHNWLRGFYFGIALLFLYGLFYGLLSSEDYALMTGSILSFTVLAFLMISTGKLDWYKINQQMTQTSKYKRNTSDDNKH
jgi:inner membrane protein